LSPVKIELDSDKDQMLREKKKRDFFAVWGSFQERSPLTGGELGGTALNVREQKLRKKKSPGKLKKEGGPKVGNPTNADQAVKGIPHQPTLTSHKVPPKARPIAGP